MWGQKRCRARERPQDCHLNWPANPVIARPHARTHAHTRLTTGAASRLGACFRGLDLLHCLNGRKGDAPLLCCCETRAGVVVCPERPREPRIAGNHGGDIVE